MTLDYEKLKLKCGLEIHQQLDTRKLFCECPSIIRDGEPDITIERKMRAVAGELGEVDPAALHEFLKNRKLIYQAFTDTNCLVELDEEPPHEINEEALEIALKIALLLNAQPFSKLQVMRKTVIDGSNTSGFQRTLLIAMDGSLETSKGKVSIPTICLEEDAARKIREEGGEVIYRVDRLGIPLIEIATSPEIKSPEEAREVAEKIGMILRVTEKVKRGLGTIRQDLNVSIQEGERTEIKGVQDLRSLAKVVEGEVKRQVMLEEIKRELKKRGAKAREIERKVVNLTEIFAKTKSKIILKAIKREGEVLGIKLAGFSGLLKEKLGPELADYARTSGVKGIFHSDELPGYGISEKEKKEVEEKLKLKKKDAFVLVAEKKDVGERALGEVAKRARLAFRGVIEETRRATPDGATKFMRPLPGAERMYPETDHPFIEIPPEKISQLRKDLPQLPQEKLKEFLKAGLGKELASQLLKSRWGEKFEEFNKKFPQVKPSLIATTLISFPKEVRRKYEVDTKGLNEEVYEEILSLVNQKKIVKEAIPEILAGVAKNPEKSVVKVIKENNLEILPPEKLDKVVEKVIKENEEQIKTIKKEKRVNFLLGRGMAKLRGKANPKELKKLLENKLKA